MQCNRCGSIHASDGKELDLYMRDCVSDENCDQANFYCQNPICILKCCDGDLCNVGDLESPGSVYSWSGLREDANVDMKDIFH